MKTISFPRTLPSLLTFAVCSFIQSGYAGSPTANAAIFKELPSIASLMSKEDFKVTGLEKLSKEELALLDKWMLNFANAVADAAIQQHLSKETASGHAASSPKTSRETMVPSGGYAPSTPAPVATVIESNIDGEFQGWSGDTIFKLTNGQIWQQATYDYTYDYEYMPSVIIYPSGGAWKMKVEGVEDTIEVRRLK